MDYKIILNTLPIPLAILTQSGNILYYNSTYKKYWDISPENNELNIVQHIHQDDLYENDLTAFLAKSTTLKLLNGFQDDKNSAKIKNTPSDWKLIAFEMKQEKFYIIYPVYFQNNQSEIINKNDLTNLETLAATVAHELRNPLGVMQLATLNIRRKRISPLIDVHIENIEKKIKESNSIITNILTFSRLPDPKYQVVNLFKLINEAVYSYNELMQKKQIAFKMDYSKLKEIMIEIDPFQIKETLLNILLNAYQAVEDKTGIVRVQGYINTNELVVIKIIDNGKGIKKENMNNIFKPFFSNKARGTGLGLTLCKEFISRHKGQIQINSKANRGTQVKISLPLRKEA